MRKHMHDSIKKAPCEIVCLAECHPVTEAIMREPVGPPQSRRARSRGGDQPSAVAEGEDPFAHRGSGYEFMTLRGNEGPTLGSCLLGVRTSVARTIELLLWERHADRDYTGKEHKKIGWTRTLIGRICMKDNVGHIGNEFVVMVQHANNQTANGVAGEYVIKNYLERTANMLIQYKVRFLLGDFNMMLFDLVPRLRERNIHIDCAAWFSWRSPIGTRMADSCGIFAINTPGIYKLHRGLDDLHEETRKGILFKLTTQQVEEKIRAQNRAREAPSAASSSSSRPAVTGHEADAESDDGFPVIQSKHGPGQHLATYLPKNVEPEEKLRPFLSPDPHSAAVAAMQQSRESRSDGCFKDRQKPLLKELWEFRGAHQYGSHFPIAVFTDNVSQRSREGQRRRNARNRNARDVQAPPPPPQSRAQASPPPPQLRGSEPPPSPQRLPLAPPPPLLPIALENAWAEDPLEPQLYEPASPVPNVPWPGEPAPQAPEPAYVATGIELVLPQVLPAVPAPPPLAPAAPAWPHVGLEALALQRPPPPSEQTGHSQQAWRPARHAAVGVFWRNGENSGGWTEWSDGWRRTWNTWDGGWSSTGTWTRW